MTDLKDKISSIFDNASQLGKSVVESIKDTAEKGKEAIEERLKEREANEIYRKLGKKVYKLVKRNELSVTDCCESYIEALDELLEDDDSDDFACVDSDDQPCVDENCQGEGCDKNASTPEVVEAKEK